MPNVYATVEDVDRLWDGQIKVADEPRVAQLLTNVHALLRSKLPSIDTAFDAGKADPVLLQMLLVHAVIRVLNNPRGVVGQSVGETSYYLSQAGANRYGELYLDDEDLALLNLGTGNRARTRVQSFRVGTPNALIRDDLWRQ